MKKIILTIFIVFVVLFWAFWYLISSYGDFKDKNWNISFHVDKWDTWKQIIDRLCSKLPWECRNIKYFSISEDMKNMKPWNYNFSWKKISEIYEQLRKWPAIVYFRFTILPWDTKFDIKERLKYVSSQAIADKFYSLIVDQNYIKTLSYNHPFFNDFKNIKSLEGFLMPDTYFFKPSDLKSSLFPELLIRTALKNFDKKRKILSEKCSDNKKCNPNKLSNYQILSIASIIEKEWIIPENKQVVADLYIRRLLQNRKLWADRTLCYGLKVLSNTCQSYLDYKHLQDKTNPYNTRALRGLPPTPVWNPTYNSIESSFFSKENTYRYYLHDSNWKIYFWKTAKEHNNNKRLYIR